MRKLAAVAREEMLVHLKQWSFYLTAVGMPLVFAALGLLPQLRAAAASTPLASMETVFSQDETLRTPTGYVDLGGLIQIIPPEQADNLYPYSDEAAAQAALRDGEIESYYLIPADYWDNGQVIHYTADPQLMTGSDTPIQAILRANVLHRLGDPNLAARLKDPVDFERSGPPPAAFSFLPADLDFSRLASAGLVIGLFAYLLNVGGYLMVRALKRESRARVLEMLVSTTSPFEFIGGKILGLSLLALGQAAITLLVGVFVYSRGPNEGGPAAIPLSMVGFSLPYLFCGYLAYCAAIMGLAAIWPNLPESTTLLAMARLTALSPVIGVVFILPNAHSAASIGLTLFPLFAPLLMPFRLLLSDVPLWQWGLGLLLLVGWAAASIWLSARLFRAQSLLTGRAPSPRMLWQAVRG